MYFLRADHKSLGGLGTSRWLEALWEPSAGLFTLPGGLDMMDISGDGDARLICADLGSVGNDSTKVYSFEKMKIKKLCSKEVMSIKYFGIEY